MAGSSNVSHSSKVNRQNEHKVILCYLSNLGRILVKTIRLSVGLVVLSICMGVLAVIFGYFILESTTSLSLGLSLLLFFIFAYFSFFLLTPVRDIFRLEGDISLLSNLGERWNKKNDIDLVISSLNDFRRRLIKLRKYYKSSYPVDYRYKSNVVEALDLWYIVLSHLLTEKHYLDFVKSREIYPEVHEEGIVNHDLDQIEKWMMDFDEYLFFRMGIGSFSPIVLINVNEIIEGWNKYLEMNHRSIYEKYHSEIKKNKETYDKSSQSRRATFWQFIFPAMATLIIALATLVINFAS